MTPGEARRTLHDAALLLSRCAGYWRDLRDRDNGWKIYYAVDADVVATYMNPRAKSSVGNVFEIAGPAIAIVTTHLIADFILRDLKTVKAGAQEQGSLLMITPHDTELESMLAAVRQKALSRLASKQEDEKALKSLFDRLHDGAKESEIIVLLLEKVPWLIDRLDGKGGPLSEIDRFSSLPSARLINMLLVQEDDVGEAFHFPEPPTDASQPGTVEFAAAYARWKQLLTDEVTAGSKPTYAITNDAFVMATIERTNALLVDERMRVVLITASSSLFGAAERVPVLSSQDGEAFAEVCLRHPQAFLGDNSFFAASQKPQRGEYGGTFRVFDWLNLILPSYIYKGDKHAVVRSKDLLKDLRTTQRDFPPAARERLDTMSSEWMQQVRLAAVSRGLSEGFYEPTPRAAVLVKELKRKAAKGITAARLLQEVSAAAMRSIAEMYGSTMYLQWLELRNEVGRVVGVPALRFDEPYPAAQAICDRIQEAMFDQPPPMFDISSLYREFKNIDKENYHAFVIHALVFAIRGHWFGTKTLCLLAISVVESIPKEQRKMRTGREAAYLLAVAERRLATRLKDLDRSLEYLQMARERENKGALPDPRFAAESLANDVARLNLRISESPDRSEASAEAVSSLRDVLNRAEGILKRMRQNELGKVRAWVRRQVTTNVINVALLAECYSAGATRGYEASLRALLSALKRAKLAPEPASERRFQDALSDTLYWAGLAVFGDDPDARRAAAHELGQVGPRVVGVDPERIKAFCALGIARATGG